MAGEVLVHFEHGHLVLAEDLPELVVGQDFAAVLRVLQVVRADVLPHLAHYLPRASGAEPTTAASYFDGCSGFCSAFDLPVLAFFSRVLVAIDLLQMLCGGIAPPFAMRFRLRVPVLSAAETL